jgi:alpha/beta superfamily hydrolase
MNNHTEKLSLHGAVGNIQALRDQPDSTQFPTPRGLAIIAHPHPLFGGTMDNKVVQTMARACVQAGWTTLRFNFRGVGESAGSHDEGRGEADDLRAILDQSCAAGTPVCLAGFSFGAFVASNVIAYAAERNALEKIVLVGAATTRFAVASIDPALHERTLVLHGELDDTVPLASVMDWARPQQLPVTVVPGGSHFFHGQLPLLKYVVLRHLMAY